MAVLTSVTLGGALLLTAVLPSVVFAAGAVDHYEVSPSPIAPIASLAANATVVVTVSAEDSTNALVPGAVINMSLSQTTGGGSASVGGTVFGSVPVAFTAASGKISVSYKTPSVLPKAGKDILKAANAHSSATISASVTYSYALVDTYVFGGIGAPGTLAAGSSNLVSVEPFIGANIAPAGTVAYLSFSPAPGGGTASVGATALTTNPAPFASSPSGQILVTYRAPAVLPATGTDTLTATDATKNPAVTRPGSYSFGGPASFVFSPSPIAAPDSAGIQNTINVQVSALDALGHPVAGAVVWLYFVNGVTNVGGEASVGGKKARFLTSTPQKFSTNSAGTLIVLYTSPSFNPTGHVDTIYAQNLRVAPTVAASDSYNF
jgi:hypothetical protein